MVRGTKWLVVALALVVAAGCTASGDAPATVNGWRSVPMPALDARVLAIVPDGNGLLVLGSVPGPDGRAPAAWTTTDGQSWHPVPLIPHTVYAAQAELVAVGRPAHPPRAGIRWRTQQSTVDSVDRRQRGPHPNGLDLARWRRLAVHSSRCASMTRPTSNQRPATAPDGGMSHSRSHPVRSASANYRTACCSPPPMRLSASSGCAQAVDLGLPERNLGCANVES